MPGMSIHVVDVSRGIVARGMRVEVLRVAPVPAVLADGLVEASGVLSDPVLMGAEITAGRYEVRFHVADYYRAQSVPLPAEPFLDVVCYAFGIHDAAQHYHLPMKTTPWGYSCFRGGA